MNRRHILAATSLALPLAAFGQSATPPEYRHIAELPGIVVSATRTPTPISQTAASVSVLTVDDFRNYKVATLADALSLLPSVNVTRTGTPGQQTSLFTRGSESNHTLMTLDGRRLPSRLDGTYDWESLSLDNVERIEFVRSANSALYGANAVGGVVNIVTQSGRGLKEPEYGLSFEGGSFQSFRESLSLRGADGPVDYSVGLSQFNAAYPRDNNDYRRSSVRGSLGRTATETLYLDVKTSYYQTDAGNPGSVTFGGSLTDHLKREVFNVSPGITWEPSHRFQSKLFYTFENQFQNSLAFGSPIRLNVASHVVDWQNTFEATADWTLTGGVLYQDQEIDQTTTAFGNLPIHASTGNLAGYAQSQWQPLERLSVISALRYDAFTDYKSEHTWKQGLAYEFGTGATLFGNVSRSVAAPSTQDLYSALDFPPFGGGPGFKSGGNPNLKPERAQTFELGVRQSFKDDQIGLSATLFRNDYRDLITFVNRTYPVASTAENINRARAEGIETELSLKPGPKFDARISFTYLTAVDQTTATRLLRRPRQQVKLRMSGHPTEKLTLTAALTGVFDQVDVGTVKLQDYVTLSASAAYRPSKQLELWVRGENLGDAKYEPIAGFPALRLGVFGGIGLTF